MRTVRSSNRLTVNFYNGTRNNEKRYMNKMVRADLPQPRSCEVKTVSPEETPLIFPTIGSLLRNLVAAVHYSPHPAAPGEPLEILESSLGDGNAVHNIFQFNHVMPKDLFRYWTSYRDYAHIYKHFSRVNVTESRAIGSRVEFRIRKGPVVIDYEVQYRYDLSEQSRGVYKMNWNLTKETRYISRYEGTIEFHPCGAGTRVISRQKIETHLPVIQKYLNKHAVQGGRDTAKGMVEWIAKQKGDPQRP